MYKRVAACCVALIVPFGCGEGAYPQELRELRIGFWEGKDLRLFSIDGQPHIVKLPCCPEGSMHRLDRQWAISTSNGFPQKYQLDNYYRNYLPLSENQNGSETNKIRLIFRGDDRL